MNPLSAAILEAAPDAMSCIDESGRMTFVNAQTTKLFGYTREELLGQRVELLIPERFRSKHVSHHQATATGQEHSRTMGGGTTAFFGRRKDGSEFQAEISLAPVTTEHGRFTVAAVRDVTARQTTERALEMARRELEMRKQQVLFQAFIEKSMDAVSLSDAEGSFVYLSPQARLILGQDGPGIRFLSIVHPDDRARMRAAREQLLRDPGGSVINAQYRVVRPDGTVRSIEATVTNLVDDPAVRGVIANFRDVTGRKAAEEALAQSEEKFHQAQKMESLGLLAGGVAHDFNNLLTVIISYAGLILDDLREGDPMRADAEEIRSAGRRAATLTAQLLAFSRRAVLQPKVLDLCEVIASMEKMLHRLIGEDIELVTDLRAEAPHAFVDRGQIEQVVMNLSVNARDAMPRGGTLTISVRPGPGETVNIDVSDDGVGMDEATKAHIFEPFFTTKEKGRGTGLGLSTVLGLIEQSGGSVTVQSAPGKGTAFQITLPGSTEDREPSAPESVGANVKGTETLLLVEDEDSVRALLRNILQRLGYRVLDARTGGDALLICEQHPGSIDLLLTDIVMPRMSGRQLAERLAPLRPKMKVLFMSGYTDDEVVRRGVASSEVPFLQKPIDSETLARTVRNVLAK